VNSQNTGQAAIAAPRRLPLTQKSMDEAALIRAAQAGDHEAFESLVVAYDQQVLRLAFNLLRSSEEAYDIYQEAFLRVHKNLSKFRFDCSFHTWLYRIVTNLCLDALRKKKVRKEEQAVIETSDGPKDRLELAAEDRAELDPQRKLLSRELRERIEGVLSGFTPGSAWFLRCGTMRGCVCGRLAIALGQPKKPPRIVCFVRPRRCVWHLGILYELRPDYRAG